MLTAVLGLSNAVIACVGDCVKYSSLVAVLICLPMFGLTHELVGEGVRIYSRWVE